MGPLTPLDLFMQVSTRLLARYASAKEYLRLFATIGVCLLPWLVFTLTLSRCISLQEDASEKKPGAKEKAGLDGDGEDGDSLPFPKRPTRHATKLLLLAFPQPSLGKINSCMEQISSIAANSTSQEDMVLAKNQLLEMIDLERQVYHYCFFHLSARLDQRLDDGGAVWTSLAPMFLDSVRALWILAASLDATEEAPRYFTFLKARYVQLSQDYFGREIETIGPPMGNLRFNPDAPPLPKKPPETAGDSTQADGGQSTKGGAKGAAPGGKAGASGVKGKPKSVAKKTKKDPKKPAKKGASSGAKKSGNTAQKTGK